MKQQCKPCITIRDVSVIIWTNIKHFCKNVRDDIKSYSLVNATACRLDNSPPMTVDHHMKAAERIRNLYKDEV